MKVGGKYNFKYQDAKLIYLGKEGSWNQFARIDVPEKVWAECLDSDLHMLEETKETRHDR